MFLHGIPGIGKSELAKAYAKRYESEYTNILYIPCDSDLRNAIIDLDFADDLAEEDDTARFKRHNRFLKSLKSDTLLIRNLYDREEYVVNPTAYIYDLVAIRRNIRELERTMPQQVKLYYAMKANPQEAVMRQYK